ncbi:MAG TPA: beta-L-arabinofuranosidase domain-containing protein [Candidatus Acidoferrales bacterium]|nr:beta-L-arabinofuranosidase domain-containing protein [Candidatus Acidoferrales bacterium]
MALSRRAFLGSAALAARARPTPPPGRLKLREFAYPQVKLTGGPLAAMYQRMHAHFLALDEDRLLKVYRQRVGLPAPGRDMGGWYDADGFVPGHLIGQFVSGLARIHAHTGDPEAAAKARRLVRGYAAAFEKDGNPYASPKAAATWACYVLDKYEIGLLDAAALAGVDEARALLPRVIAGAVRFIPDHTFDRVGTRNPPYDEPYILPENLFQTYGLTGDRRFLDMAKLYLLDQEFFDPLSEGRNVLPGKHGYSHVIALSSGAKAYEVLGDGKYLRAIRNAWDMIEQTQQYASGAWAPRETFVKPGSGELAASLTATRDHFETPCCFYAHAKLARYLTCFTGDSRYGDGLERTLLNTILGALDPDDDGGYFYYSDYQARAQKRYYQRKWPCCAGTLLQSVADYPLDLYFHDAGGIYVNLYAASEVRWTADRIGIKLTQTTAYPESEQIELRVDPDQPLEFDLHLRIPGWLDRPAHLSLNGKPLSVQAARGTFATIRHRWRKGDTVGLTLPFSLRAVPIDDRNPDTIAVMRGPVMLTAVDPPEQLAASPAALAAMDPVPGKPLEFDCRCAAEKVRMRPFYQVRREPYSTYFRVALDRLKG